MRRTLIPLDSSLKSRNQSKRSLWQSYLRIGILSNIVIWGAAGILLKILSPTYTSMGAMLVAGVGSSASIQLPDTGQASADKSNESPYDYLWKIDPRQNYQYIAMSEAVLSRAAASLDMTTEEFGEPEIKLQEGTTIIEFEIDGKSPAKAQQKAQAFYQALIEHIDYLRAQEKSRQNDSIQNTLQFANNRLEESQRKLSEFKSDSPLKVKGQINQLSDRLEDLRVERANLLTQQQAVSSRFQQLSASLNLPEGQATEALILLDDPVFQKSLQTYSDVSANLEVLSSVFTSNSPQIIDEEAKKRAATEAMLARSRAILGKPLSIEILGKLNLGAEQGRRNLVEKLIELQGEQQALTTKVSALERQITQLEKRLKTLAQEQFTLNRLERDSQIAESVFISKLSQLDLDKPDYATSYPVLQLMVEPTLPEESTGKKQKIILLGALAISFLVTTGLIILWWDAPNSEEKIFANANSTSEAEL